jgi:hypothetical protein
VERSSQNLSLHLLFIPLPVSFARRKKNQSRLIEDIALRSVQKDGIIRLGGGGSDDAEESFPFD